MDAFANILNEVPAYALDLPADARPADAPVSSPFIRATAPYLHNGSVPNSRALLTPPAQRSTSFAVGSRGFDPVNLGFDTTATGSAATIPGTRLPGTANAGRVWGTDLSEADRLDLMEYLTSL